MNPSIKLINILLASQTIRNECFSAFLEHNNFIIDLRNFICYTIGNAENKRIVNCFSFIGQSNSDKMCNYLVKWWNTATFKDYSDDQKFECIEFWVHSGMALRKAFFNYEDKMSLFRSTFIYDEINKKFYRLVNLNSFIHIPIISNYNCFIFSSENRYYLNQKEEKKNKQKRKCKNLQLIEIQKKFIKLLKNKNYSSFIRVTNIKLFNELHNFINLDKDGSTSTI